MAAKQEPEPVEPAPKHSKVASKAADSISSLSSPWDIIGVTFDHALSQAGTSERPDEELARYISAPGPDRNADPLEWRKGKAMNFPTPANIAKKRHLCACIFSTSGTRFFDLLEDE